MLTILMLAGCLEGSHEASLWDETQATTALEQAMASSKAEILANRIMEITTDVTMGERAADAAKDRAAWFESQIPCSTATVEGSTLTINFGTLLDKCVYDGKTYAGVLEITWRDRGVDDLEIIHGWFDFTDGTVMLNGETVVYWTSPSVPSRVTNDLTWSDDERTVDQRSDVFIERIRREAGQTGNLGVELNGWRLWEDEANYGTLYLDIDGIQIRGVDPVPQAGTWRLRNDDGDVLRMHFDRVDADTIRVTIEGDGWTRIIYVTSEEKAGMDEIEPPDTEFDDGRLGLPDREFDAGGQIPG